MFSIFPLLAGDKVAQTNVAFTKGQAKKSWFLVYKQTVQRNKLKTSPCKEFSYSSVWKAKPLRKSYVLTKNTHMRVDKAFSILLVNGK